MQYLGLYELYNRPSSGWKQTNKGSIIAVEIK